MLLLTVNQLPESTATTASPSPLHSPSSPTQNPLSKSNDYGYDYDEDDDNPLPYPAPLPRSDFLAPDFSPEEYLSTLRNRHQTLEDLRSDLRSRSQLLSRELLDLVNSNYEEFLSLGGTLKGGEDKAEEVRLGVLGFQREVKGVRDVVVERQEQVGRLLEERRTVRRDVAVGRRLLDIEERLVELEERLMVEPNAERQMDTDEEDEEDDDNSDDEEQAVSNEARAASVALTRLQRHAQMFLLLKHLMEKVHDHPFVVAQHSRILRVRNTLLLDLRTAMKQAQKAGLPGGQLLKFVVIYRELGEAEEAVKALGGS